MTKNSNTLIAGTITTILLKVDCKEISKFFQKKISGLFPQFSVALICIIFLSFIDCNAQVGILEDINRMPGSNFSALKASNDDMNPFTGVNNISILLYQLKENEINIPINLNYSSGGVLLDEEPGLVGLSWEVSAGGLIRRKVNNIPDESCGGLLLGPGTTQPYRPNYNNTEWENITLTEVYSTYKPGYFFATMNPPGMVMNLPKDLNPDEFFFNFNGISGSFFMGLDGTWKVKSDANISIKVNASFGSLPDLMVTIKEFQITDQHGIVYFFGGDESSIERSLNIVNYSPFLMGNATFIADFNNQAFTSLPNGKEKLESFPMTWRITKIMSPSGSVVKFNYIQHGVRGLGSTSYVKNRHSSEADSNGFTQDVIRSGTDVRPSFLTSIETDNEIIIFNKSVSKGYYQRYIQHYDPDYNDNAYFKLDLIEIKKKANGESLKKIQFNYIERITERLKLQGLTFIANGLSNEHFTFFYNPMLLQSYGSNTDHWGFNSTKSRKPVYLADEFFDSKEADLNSLQSEMLISIKAPHGGTTSFIYESNAFSKVAKHYPFVIDNYSGYGGGIRLKKIITNPLVGPSLEKEYFYLSSGFTDGPSSGVLSAVPKYTFNEQGNIAYQSFMVNTPSRTFGRDVTYSRVVEKSNGGFKVWTFSNLDNGFMDIAGTPVHSTTPSTPYTSKELLRGKVLKEEYYSSHDNPIKIYEKQNSYLEDYSKSLPATGYGPNQGLATADLSPSANFLNYIFTPSLKRTVEKMYANNEEVVEEVNYLYNSKNLLSYESTLNSDARLKEIEYKYPLDIVQQGNDPTQVYSNMVSKNIVAKLTGKTERVAGVEMSSVKMNYANYNNGNNQWPQSVEIKTINNAIQTQVQYNKYDHKGNLLEDQKSSGLKTSYLWGYNKRYPIAVIQNSDYTTVEMVLGGSISLNSFSDSNPTDAQVNTVVNILRNSPLLKDAQITSCTYKPLVGMTSSTDPKGMTTYYEYDEFGRLKWVKDQNGNIIKENTYHYKN